MPMRLMLPLLVRLGRLFFCGALLGQALGLIAAEPQATSPSAELKKGEWHSLFNGQDLTGWTPKIRGEKLGENWGDTFRVADGLLQVRYDKYDQYNEKFGHLFYKDKFSHYRFRVEYRFVGDQCPGGPGWAIRNSGIMLHGQDPATMTLDQDFPASLEAQLLGGDGKNDRTTGNLCTPGTNVVLNGKLFLPHCVNAKSKTYHGDQWVTAEVEVHGNKLIKHLINGETVIEYTEPQLDDRDGSAQALLKAGQPKMLSEGTISLQSESHPIDFRKIEIMILDE
ncbi:MAG: DUF1080 domain-containing protein [Pirellulales bacterium]|nr:DUF1080 domain-containing protein [Pirellulales bacterium]